MTIWKFDTIILYDSIKIFLVKKTEQKLENERKQR